MLELSQFLAAQRLAMMIDYGDSITYADLSAADRELLAAYRCEEDAFFEAQIAALEEAASRPLVDIDEELPF